jgi:chromosomal replication initiator protein
MRLIIDTVTDYYKINPRRLFDHTKKENIKKVRWMIYFLAREMTDASYPQIGSFLNQDHSTVVHAVQQMKLKLQSCDELRKAEIALRQKLMPIYVGKQSKAYDYWGA